MCKGLFDFLHSGPAVMPAQKAAGMLSSCLIRPQHHRLIPHRKQNERQWKASIKCICYRQVAAERKQRLKRFGEAVKETAGDSVSGSSYSLLHMAFLLVPEPRSLSSGCMHSYCSMTLHPAPAGSCFQHFEGCGVHACIDNSAWTEGA